MLDSIAKFDVPALCRKRMTLREEVGNIHKCIRIGNETVFLLQLRYDLLVLYETEFRESLHALIGTCIRQG